jgi:hypothetical protein
MLYVASSWRNEHQPGVVRLLRNLNYQVYDYRHPCAGDDGFAWSEIDKDWRNWNPQQFSDALLSPISFRGFSFDFASMARAQACVLVLPSGRSAHLEAGYFVGQGKPLIVYMPEPVEPELMYLMANKIVLELAGLVPALRTFGVFC